MLYRRKYICFALLYFTGHFSASDAILSTAGCKQTSLTCEDQTDRLIDENKYRAEKSLRGNKEQDAPKRRNNCPAGDSWEDDGETDDTFSETAPSLSGLQQSLLSPFTPSHTNLTEGFRLSYTDWFFVKVCFSFISSLKVKVEQETEIQNMPPLKK